MNLLLWRYTVDNAQYIFSLIFYYQSFFEIFNLIFIFDSDIDRVAQIIGTGLYHMTITNSEYTEVSSRQQWLLQLMSHVKNVASKDHAQVIYSPLVDKLPFFG